MLQSYRRKFIQRQLHLKIRVSARERRYCIRKLFYIRFVKEMECLPFEPYGFVTIPKYYWIALYKVLFNQRVGLPKFNLTRKSNYKLSRFFLQHSYKYKNYFRPIFSDYGIKNYDSFHNLFMPNFIFFNYFFLKPRDFSAFMFDLVYRMEFFCYIFWTWHSMSKRADYCHKIRKYKRFFLRLW